MEELVAAQAVNWPKGHRSVDYRPHVKDANSGQFLLLDSGSQVTAWTPDEGDTPLPGMFLKAVNNSKIKCYGFKNVDIRIGRKNYSFKAIKADIAAPVIGWDFVDKYKLNYGYNKFGDIVINDPKADISSPLTFKAVPHVDSLRTASLQWWHLEPISPSVSGIIDPDKGSPPVTDSSGWAAANLAFQIASIQELGEEVPQNLSKVPEGPYKCLLEKYPDLLVDDFKTEEPKNNISPKRRLPAQNLAIKVRVQKCPELLKI